MVTAITTHAVDGKARLGWALQKPRLLAVVGALLDRYQLIEDLLHQILLLSWLEDAVGVLLDEIGDLVGQPRNGGAYPNGEADAVYRRRIGARIVANSSGGTVEDVIQVCQAWLGTNCVKVHCADVPEASINVTVQVTVDLTTDEAATLAEFLVATKLGGVQLVGAAWYVAPTFAWAGAPDPPFLGYDDGTGLVGGGWAVYFYP